MATLACELNGIVDLFSQAVPNQFFDQLQRGFGLPVRQRVFTLPLVIWMMISQRLSPKATLSTAVQGVVHGPPHQLLPHHKRIREGTVSCHTGAYSDARQAIPVGVAEQVADRVLDHLMTTCREALPGWKRRVFILDGSSLKMPHTPDLVEAYPPDPKSHWPVLRTLVAQELTTGLAQRPCWGPMYGPRAVSEQALTEKILDRIPHHSVVMGDINFGVFTVAFAATRRDHDILVRLQLSRAAVVGRGWALKSGLDREVCWRPRLSFSKYRYI
jgi:putative transposase